MPTYEYLCPDCEHKFERFQSITAPSVRLCPVCGRRHVKRLIGSGGGLIFKGSGFYSTDYRSESYAKQAKAETETSAPKSETPAAKPGAKPAASAGRAKSS
jgi:putative FmdB family regulatory protein